MPINENNYTEKELTQIGKRLIEIFNLKKSKGFVDRWEVEGGNKTALGVARTFIRVAQEIEDKTPVHQIYRYPLT